jgi:anti-sigma regulatory factor (Ser/Thr protein kinase)/HAMP domain-containing protein
VAGVVTTAGHGRLRRQRRNSDAGLWCGGDRVSDDEAMMRAATRGWRLADRPIRVKLGLLLLPPILAVLALSGVIGYEARAAQTQAEQARQLVALGSVCGQLAAALQHERALAALVFARRSAAPAIAGYTQQTQAADAVTAQFTGSLDGLRVPAGLQTVVGRLRSELAGLPLLREQVRSGSDATASVTVFRYGAMIADLINYRSAMSQLGVQANTADGLRASATLSQAIESLGSLQVDVLPSLAAGRFTPAAQQQVVAADAGFSRGIDDFRQLAADPWPARLSAQTGGRAAVTGERLQAQAVSNLPDQPLDLDTSADAFVTTLGARLDQLHAVEHALDGQLLAQVSGQRDDEQRRIAVLGAAVAVALALATAVAVGMTRSMTRPLRALNSGATLLATSTLPQLVATLTQWRGSVGDLNDLIEAARPQLPVHGRDEVGAVAEAFNGVGAEAIRLAGKEARLRQLNEAMVETLARRMQNVSGVVAARLDALEAREDDPARLRLLFSLDEAVTAANRSVFSMLTLIGRRAGQQASEPVAISTVVKIAIGWVEGAAPRVQDTGVTAHCLIDTAAVSDLAHLLAELLSNAVGYSPSREISPDQTDVTVTATLIGDRLLVQVLDWGISVKPERLPKLQKLIDEFDIEAAVQQMGLSVVGILARRLGATVTLRYHEDGTRGVCADVIVPGTVLVKAPPPSLPPAPAAIPAPHPMPVSPRPVSVVSGALSAPTMALPGPGWPIAGRRSPDLDGTPAPPLTIFTQVVQGHRSLFEHGGDGPGISQPWRAAAQTATLIAQRNELESNAQASGSVGVADRTRGGLPKRVPNQSLIPELSDEAAAVPRQRDPDVVQRGFASLGAAVQHLRS